MRRKRFLRHPLHTMSVTAEGPVRTNFTATRITYKTSQPVQQTLANLHAELQFDTWKGAEYEKHAQAKLAVKDLVGFEEVIRQRENKNELL